MDAREGYLAAAASFGDLVAHIGEAAAQDWNGPGLGEWSLRDLMGHAVSSGLREVVAAFDRQPSSTPVIRSPEAYYALAGQVDPAVYAAAVASSTEDARRTGLALSAGLVTTVHDLVDVASRKVLEASPSAVVVTAAGAMILDEWLPTRIFELAVHGLDIASRTGATFVASEEVVGQALVLAARIAVVTGDGPAVLRALTGRAELPRAFSVI